MVVERPDEGVWEYHWCLKSSTPVEDFFFIWPDVGWPGGDTSCGGFWGGNLTSPYPPIVLQSSASIGPDLWPIQPQIKKPARYPPTQFWHKVLEYVSEFFASLHLDKEGKDVVTVEITVRSTATPIIANDEHIATEYQVAYSSRYEIASSSSLSTGVSPIRFSFSHNLVGQAFELDGEFSLDEPRPVKFTKVGPPTNIIGAIVFVGPDGYEVGSMPISLAVPSE